MSNTPGVVPTCASRKGWQAVVLALGLWLTARLPIWWANGWLGLHPWARVTAWVAGCVLMIGLPLLLRWRRPRLAAPAPAWRPPRKRDWAWAFGLLLVILAVSVVLQISLIHAGDRHYARWLVDDLWLSGPAAILAEALILVVIGPVAEEFFYRGYLQTQLEQVLPRWVAVVFQAVIFAIAHMYMLSLGVVMLWYGLALGWWRATKRSLLPIVLIHVAINALAVLPHVQQRYYEARLMDRIGGTSEAFQTPQAREARAVSSLPLEQAVPQLLALTESPDHGANITAHLMLHKQFGQQAIPLFLEYLESGDDQRVEQVIAHVGLMVMSDRELYLPLLPAIREAVRQSEVSKVHVSALILFRDLHDAEGLAVLAAHPAATQNMRAMAQRSLDRIREHHD